MNLYNKLLGLPPALLLLVVSHVTAQGLDQLPTAIRKMPPDSGAKFFPEYVAFDSASTYDEAPLSPREAVLAARLARDDELLKRGDGGFFRPVFKTHEEAEERSGLRRAAEVLHILQKRESCPSNMASCSKIGFPNKCCFAEEECVKVDDSTVGNVACCPNGIDCSGGVGACPSTAVTCPADLGGGCCIAGYICKGLGCKSRPSPDITKALVANTPRQAFSLPPPTPDLQEPLSPPPLRRLLMARRQPW